MKYIRLFVYCLLFVCALSFPYHTDAQVVGNKFLDVYYPKVSTQNATITARTPEDVPAGNDVNRGIQNAFDGKREGTWWYSTQAGTINVNLSFPTPVSIFGFHIYGSGNPLEREETIIVYTSLDGQSWTPIKKFQNDRSRRDNDYFLDHQVKNVKYLRLQLAPGASSDFLAINEITLYSRLDIASDRVTHKRSKWFDLRTQISEATKNLDRFNDETPWFTLQDGTTQIQAAHVSMDTIYVHKGTSVKLVVPDKLHVSSVVSYQRWYSFQNDGIFRTRNVNGGEVWDLLTPTGNIQPYRMANGYIGKPLTSGDLMEMNFYVPTDEEFETWFGGIGANDNNYYLVGCDVSGYTDFTQEFSTSVSGSSQFYPTNQPDGLTYEPTLTHRVIYYIQTVDGPDDGQGNTGTETNGINRLKDPEYQGGGDDGKYLEVYDISFPFTRVSNHTLEVVALSKDARSYAIPGVEKTEDHSNLNVRLVDGGSGVTLQTTSLSDMSRVIQFRYPQTNPKDNTQYVNANNSTATIFVTKTVGGKTYNIAKYHLTFVRDTRLITQSQLKQIEDGSIQDEYMKFYQFRTDKYLEENYQLLTKLNFDYDYTVGNIYGEKGYYPFPLDWTSNSYSFYDGANGNDFKKQNGYYPEWGYYAIMSGFMENLYWGSSSKAQPLPGSTYHMYIDASDRAGVIARLPFRQNLCPGSEMFVTAWVKSAVNEPDELSDAGMLFSVMGVTKDNKTGEEIYVPIYRHASGQIRRTDFLSGMPGTGSGTNEWMQMYFSFIIDSHVQFDSYVLQVENNSASTVGGDMYLDDIRVYMATPSAKITQLEATCVNERTLMSIELDWERLLSRLGDVEGKPDIEGIDFCFIDKAKYDTYLAANPSDYEGAIEASVVEIGNDEEGENFYSEKYNSMFFDLRFENNTLYGEKRPSLPRDNEGTGVNKGKYFFYRTTDEAGIRALAVDFYSKLTPNRSYLMLIQINDGNEANAEDFAESINETCAIVTPFYVTAQSLLRVNGEVVDPTTDFCAGQIFSFSAQVRIPQSNEDGTESYITVDKGVYFDWFFGSEEEFLEANPLYGDESLESALLTFRDIFPDKTDLSGVVPGVYETIDGKTETLTQNAISLIDHYIQAKDHNDALSNRLVLHKDKIDITLLQSGLKLVVQPIPTLVSPGGNIDPTLWANVCWSYIPLELNASGAAPQLRAGFNALKYPSEEFNPGLRIGLGQIDELSEAKPLKVSLRGAKLVTSGAESLGMVTSASPDIFNKVYLIDTNDPAYKNETFFPTDFSEYSLPVGVIKSLQAHPYTTDSPYDDYMEIYFDTNTIQSNGFQFTPKEGYAYTLAIHFEEKMKEDQASANSCFGVFHIEMKVVPEYLKWSASDATGNWNNDANWKRADKDDLKKTDADSYPTNEDNTTANGYIPMLFSKVILPKDSRVELYMAGFGDSGNAWINSSRPEHMQLPTENVQYDLMAYYHEGQYSAERYRVNLCQDIHFEPGAQMLHAEQLLYDKAWIDMEIAPRQWVPVSVPLQGVVAGDWYAPTTNGRQETEYFKDITFGNGYNRLNPAVYQRSWSAGASIVENNQGGSLPVSFDTDWSSVYNDAAVPYTAGAGFSVKGILNQGSSQAQTPLLFRFPKADESYDVAAVAGSLDRKNAGKLLTDTLMSRKDPNVYEPPVEATITLYPSSDGKYLMIGNPFTASLDIQAFMEANRDVLQQKYWLDPDMEKEPAVVYDDQEDRWSDGPRFAAPYTVFYVAASNPSEANSGVPVKITADMQAFDAGDATGENKMKTVRIEAVNAVGKSVATLIPSLAADNQYLPEEDAEMILNLDGNDSQAPMVYTIAGDRAVSANQVKDARLVPLGVFVQENSPVTLVFHGVDALNHAFLYDAEQDTETCLTDGYSLTVNGSSHGRYFICMDETTDMEEHGDDRLSVYSVVPNQLVVSSDSQLDEITVWTADGIQIQHVRPESKVCTLNYIPSGLVLVKIQSDTPVVRKVVVK